MNMEKKCRKCREIKWLAQFQPMNIWKYWVASTCKSCQMVKDFSSKKTSCHDTWHINKINNNIEKINNIMDFKKCTKCLQEKTLNNFSKDNQKKDWLRPSCKKCNKKWLTRREISEKNIIEINKTWNKQCSKCDKFLTLDNFRKDSTKIVWYYSSCNDCYRERTGSKKMIPAKIYNCDWCWVEFKPKVNQFNNIKEKIFCNIKCSIDSSLETRQSPYWWYRKYILERDKNRCVISWDTGLLDIHHIKTVWSWGTNEYSNLITLSRRVHISLAHWKEASE